MNPKNQYKKSVEQGDRAEIGGSSPMMLGGFFCQVLLGVLAKFRSPPIPLIAGVRQDVMPLRRGNSEILTHKDTLTRDIKLTLGKALTRAKAYALTGEYSTHADNRISAHAGKQTISLTREKNGIIRMRLTEGKRISS